MFAGSYPPSPAVGSETRPYTILVHHKDGKGSRDCCYTHLCPRQSRCRGRPPCLPTPRVLHSANAWDRVDCHAPGPPILKGNHSGLPLQEQLLSQDGNHAHPRSRQCCCRGGLPCPPFIVPSPFVGEGYRERVTTTVSAHPHRHRVAGAGTHARPLPLQTQRRRRCDPPPPSYMCRFQQYRPI
jgi:hypothetical protein